MKAIVRTKPNLALVPCKLKTHLQNTTNSLRDQENWTRECLLLLQFLVQNRLLEAWLLDTTDCQEVPRSCQNHWHHSHASHPLFVTFHMACIWIKSLPERETQTLHDLGSCQFHLAARTLQRRSASAQMFQQYLKAWMDGDFHHTIVRRSGWRWATWWGFPVAHLLKFDHSKSEIQNAHVEIQNVPFSFHLYRCTVVNVYPAAYPTHPMICDFCWVSNLAEQRCACYCSYQLP